MLRLVPLVRHVECLQYLLGVGHLVAASPRRTAYKGSCTAGQRLGQTVEPAHLVGLAFDSFANLGCSPFVPRPFLPRYTLLLAHLVGFAFGSFASRELALAP